MLKEGEEGDNMLTTRKRILCVDDDPINLGLFRDVLILEGYDVLTADNGMTGLDFLHTEKIDLVILDLLMPQMDGLEVCRKIREEKRFAAMPIVMISGLGTPQDRKRGMEAGADDFLMKPFHINDIVSKVRIMLRFHDLQEKICAADAAMAATTSFGDEVMHTDGSCYSDLLSGLDSLVGRVFRHGQEAGVGPEIVLAGVLENKRRRWFYYSHANCSLNRTLLAIDVGWCLNLPKEGGESLFCNGEDEIRQSFCRPLIQELGSMHITVTSMAGYMSSDLSVIAMNYGRSATKYDAWLMQSLASQGIFLRAVSKRMMDCDDSLEHIVSSLGRLSEAGDLASNAYIKRLGDYASLLAQHLNMPEGFINAIRLQSQLHDIGNLHIPAAILRKPAELTDAEFCEIKNHTLYGAQILGEHKGFQIGRNIALTHHERWDGSGYPYGLKEEQIPIEGRIVNIADQYDSLRNRKIYRPSFDHYTSCRIIMEGDNRTMPYHFDPRILTAFRTAAPRLQEVYEQYSH